MSKKRPMKKREDRKLLFVVGLSAALLLAMFVLMSS